MLLNKRPISAANSLSSATCGKQVALFGKWQIAVAPESPTIGNGIDVGHRQAAVCPTGIFSGGCAR